MMMPMHDLRDDRGDDSNGEKDCYVDKYDFNNEKKSSALVLWSSS